MLIVRMTTRIPKRPAEKRTPGLIIVNKTLSQISFKPIHMAKNLIVNLKMLDFQKIWKN